MKTARILAAGLMAAWLWAAAAGVYAAASGAGISGLPENQKLIDGYTLTLENVRKTKAATDLFHARESEKAEDGLDTAEQREEPLVKQWLAIEKADTTGILRKTGISARDYVLTLTVLMQTTFDAQLNVKPRTATNAANIAFYKKNRAELEKFLE